MVGMLNILNNGQARFPRIFLSLLVCMQLFLAGCGDKSADGDAGIDGLGKFHFGISSGRAVLSVVFENLVIDAGARIPLTRPEGAFVELSPDFNSAGMLFVFSVPLASLIKGNGDLPQFGLPDGRPLPGVTNGVLGAMALSLPVLGNTFLYLGADAFGIFFPLRLPNLPAMVRTNIRDEKGNILGVIFGIPEGSSGSISGIFFLFPVEGSSSMRFLRGFL